MKVIKRSQITEVVTKRMVFHEVELNGVKYRRLVKSKIHVPYMDSNVIVSEPKISWAMYLNHNTIQDLTKKEAENLNLESLYQALDIVEKNGND